VRRHLFLYPKTSSRPHPENPHEAVGALAEAQEAAKKQDSEAVIRHATGASEQAFLGLAQSG
jgi:hypothetical protein